jgi:actin-related protein
VYIINQSINQSYPTKPTIAKMVQAAGIDPAPVVIDNGTGFTKMGYAGNMEPSYLIPTIIAKKVQKVSHTTSRPFNRSTNQVVSHMMRIDNSRD